MKQTFSFFALFLIMIAGRAQMADGSIAPNWTMTDTDGNTHTLYDYLDNGQTVFLDFFATWCGPCWSYAQGGAMEQAHTQYGPGGTNEIMIFSIEGDVSTNSADLNGTGSNTQGNWISLLGNPIIDDDSQTSPYQIGYWPTIYKVCPNRLIYEVGQLSSAVAYQQAAQACPPPATNANDATMLTYSGNLSSDCNGSVSLSATIQNSGTGNLSSVTIVVTDGSGNTVSTTPWTGNLSTYSTENVSLGTATVPPSGDTFTITITTSDDDMTNNSTTQVINGVVESPTTTCHLTLIPDNYGSETSWELKISGGATVYAGGPYVDGSTTPVTATFNLTNGTCYEFIINDAYGDGICCSYGTGSYTVTDDNSNYLFTGGEFGASEQKNFNVNTGGTTTPPSITASGNNLNCNGDCNGSISTSVSGGTGTLTYSWSSNTNGQSGSTATGLCAGTYNVTVSDGNGDTSTDSYTITEPSVLSSTSSTIDPGCGQNNGTATISASGGTAPYTYSWNDPSAQNGSQATQLAAGNYQCIISDANGCTTTETVALSSPNSGTATVNSSDVSCFGGNDGTATVNMSGGTAPFTYIWSSGASGTTANNLAPGNYTITVTDNNSCVSVSSVTVSEPAEIALNVNGSSSTCGNSDGSATASAVNGSSPYNYSWQNGDSGNTTTGLSAGSYNLTVTDANGCTQTSVISISDSNGGTVSTSSTDALCNGQSTGSATANMSGGTSPFTYNWGSGASGETQSNLSAGTYLVTCTDAIGCISVANVVVSEPAELAATFDAIADTAGDCSGSGTVIPTGGTAPYSYAWTNPSGETGPTVTGLCTGMYSVLITDNNGCTTTESFIITTQPIGFKVPERVINKLELFPNPAKGVLFIKGLQSTSNNLQVFNMTGMLIKTYSPNIDLLNGNVLLNVEDIASGMYMIKSGNQTALFSVLR